MGNSRAISGSYLRRPYHQRRCRTQQPPSECRARPETLLRSERTSGWCHHEDLVKAGFPDVRVLHVSSPERYGPQRQGSQEPVKGRWCCPVPRQSRARCRSRRWSLKGGTLWSPWRRCANGEKAFKGRIQIAVISVMQRTWRTRGYRDRVYCRW